jgi:predicted Rossmann fold nucleotide-binding protein DprA/Smf involved in DNA uptake
MGESQLGCSVRKLTTKETAVYRNRFVAALADAVLIAYAHPGSSTEQLAREIVDWGKPVYTLPHESTVGLQIVAVRILEGQDDERL